MRLTKFSKRSKRLFDVHLKNTSNQNIREIPKYQDQEFSMVTKGAIQSYNLISNLLDRSYFSPKR